MLIQKCHEANDTPSSIFRIVTCRLNCIPTWPFTARVRHVVCCARCQSLSRRSQLVTHRNVVSWGADLYQHALIPIVNTVYTWQPDGSCLPSAQEVLHYLSWAQNKRANILTQSTLPSWNLYERWNKHPGCITQYMPRYKACKSDQSHSLRGQSICRAGYVFGQFETVCWCRCTVFVVHREQMALPLTPPCVFLSPSWTTAWRDPYLVIVGGGKGKALKARLCGDAIRQTAVGPQSPPHPNPPSPIPLIALLLFKNHKEMLMEHSEAPWVLFEQQKLLDRPRELCGRYHVEFFPVPNHK